MSWNQQLVKVNNKSLILNTIKDQGPLSRADLSQRLGLTKGTVSSLVSELLHEHLCYETGPGESSGGRRPVMVSFNQTSGYSIGIDLGVNYILGIITDLNGTIIDKTTTHFQKTTYSNTVLAIKNIIRNLFLNTPDSHYGVVGIGIGIPGIINNQGRILLTPNLDWEYGNLLEEIQQEFQLPVIIENEANAGAYGEKFFGAGRNYENLIYVSAGIGIGVGMIFNNKLYKGTNGFSGEMGHMIIQTDGRECSCGSNGCWELYASEKALLEEANHILKDEQPFNLEALIELARSNKEIASLFKQVGYYLGVGINNIINTFNPEQIIIGNRLAMAKDLLDEPMKKVIKNNTLKQHQENLKITFSNLTIYSAALGVSAYATENFLKSDLARYKD
ncbi:ROK family protein [Anaerobacillus alkalilacustris]|uniref:ROK family protein n=1 Tax=Anaerobacillus alkalilacustris TaxID=393763 RepID=A0A1S2LHR0_9BACI|nr:ROK family transcriptional regulator [Anaerobacillus alkalilacustris]OIJ12059.1 ROK family protein [Anaerobacillus alkalilacustris]